MVLEKQPRIPEGDIMNDGLVFDVQKSSDWIDSWAVMKRKMEPQAILGPVERPPLEVTRNTQVAADTLLIGVKQTSMRQGFIRG